MTPTPEEARALAERLMKSWDADQSIIRQTDMWMRERRDAADTLRALLARAEKAEAEGVTVQEDGFLSLVRDGMAEGDKAMLKFPQPNYVISKFAEEAGEVVKAAIHCAEGRETPENVLGEMRQVIAMMYRLWVEGDQVHALRALSGDRHD